MKLKWWVLLVLVASVLSVPLWGGCGLNEKVCSTWCNVRHLDSDIKAAGCRARCQADKLTCLAKQGSHSLDDFIEGFRH